MQFTTIFITLAMPFIGAMAAPTVDSRDLTSKASQLSGTHPLNPEKESGVSLW